MQEHGRTTGEFARSRSTTPPDWLRGGTAKLTPAGGRYLALRDDDGELDRSFAIERGWTRIGRSATADLRLDDPSVSRRHALIVAEPGTAAARPRRPQPQRRLPQRRDGRVGDGCDDGDELAIGRYRLFVLDSA